MPSQQVEVETWKRIKDNFMRTVFVLAGLVIAGLVGSTFTRSLTNHTRLTVMEKTVLTPAQRQEVFDKLSELANAMNNVATILEDVHEIEKESAKLRERISILETRFNSATR